MKDWTGNQVSVYKIIGANNHSNTERERYDYYATNPYAIDKLLQVESPCKKVWECACGNGHLSKRLKDFGYEVISSDIIERDFKCDFEQDFLKISACGLGTNEVYDIITNPPYKFAKEFVLKSLDVIKRGQKVYMFLKLTFLEGQERYKDLFSKYPPQTIYVFSKRINCAKNGEFGNSNATGAVAYAWFVWQKGYTGETIIKWI